MRNIKVRKGAERFGKARKVRCHENLFTSDHFGSPRIASDYFGTRKEIEWQPGGGGKSYLVIIDWIQCDLV